MAPKDKFIWEPGDLKVMTEEEFRNMIAQQQSAPKDFCPLCSRNTACSGCVPQRREQAQTLAQRVFLGYFADPKADDVLFRRVMQGLTGILQKYCGEKTVLTKELYLCTKVLLVNAVMEKTKITVTPAMLDALFPRLEE